MVGVTLDRTLLEEYLVRAAWAVGVVLVTTLLARGVQRGATGVLRRRNAHSSATTLVAGTARGAIWLIGLLVVLAIFSGEAFAWVLGSFSVLGIVVGLSLQDLLRNFFAGVWILIEQPIRIGDTVEMTGHIGVVEEISFRVTRLRAPDGRTVIVPNAALMTSTIVNLSRASARRVTLSLDLPAGDVAAQLGAIRETLAAPAGVLREPAPAIELRGVSAGRARYAATFWSLTPDATATETLGALRARLPDVDAHAA